MLFAELICTVDHTVALLLFIRSSKALSSMIFSHLNTSLFCNPSIHQRCSVFGGQWSVVSGQWSVVGVRGRRSIHHLTNLHVTGTSLSTHCALPALHAMLATLLLAAVLPSSFAFVAQKPVTAVTSTRLHENFFLGKNESFLSSLPPLPLTP